MPDDDKAKRFWEDMTQIHRDNQPKMVALAVDVECVICGHEWRAIFSCKVADPTMPPELLLCPGCGYQNSPPPLVED